MRKGKVGDSRFQYRNNLCISQGDIVRDENTGDADEFKFSDDEIEGKSSR